MAARSATVFWDGGGTDARWTTANNWSTNVPWNPADDVVFASSFASGTSIQLNGNKTVNSLSVNNGTDFSLNGDTLTLASGDITRTATSGTTTIHSAVGFGGSATWNISGNLTANGVISGAYGLTKSGSGTVTLTNSNSYTGDTTISAGIVNIRNAAALGATSGDTVVNAGGELQVQGGISVAAGETLSLTGSGAGGSGGAALRNISGNNAWADTITLQNIAGEVRINSDSGTLTIGSINETGNNNKILVIGGAGDVVIAGVVSGKGKDTSIRKEGAGTLRLSGNNAYTGTTVVSSGTLVANNIVVTGGTSNLGNSKTEVTLGSAGAQGTLSYTGNSATYTRGFTIGGAGGGRLEVTTAGQTLTVSNDGITGSGLFTVGGPGNTTVSASIAHAGGLTKTGTGTLTLSNTGNSYTGLTDIQNGTLALGAGNVLANASTVRVSGGTLSLGTNSDTVAGVQLAGGSITGSTGVLTSTNTYDFQSGAVSGILGGAVGVNKTTVGTVTLSAANLYTGNTNVSEGTLFVTNTLGSGTGTGAVNVSANATLGGTGTISGNVTIAGIHSPGVSNMATQSFAGSLTYAAGSILAWDLDSPANDTGLNTDNQGSYDRVAAGSLAGVGSLFHILLDPGSDFSDAFWNTDKTWNNIFTTSTGTPNLAAVFSGGFGGDVASNGMVAGQGIFSFSGNNLTWTHMPEPSSLLYGVLAATLMLRRKRPCRAEC